MSIKIEKRNGTLGDYYEAGGSCMYYRSVNGVAWIRPDGELIGSDRGDELRTAFFAYLDSQAEPAEPVRAKVGEHIKITEHHPSGAKVCVDSVHEVVSLCEWGVCIPEIERGGTWAIGHDEYTIVPAPTLETFTGDPIKEKWGDGLFETIDKSVRVAVYKNGVLPLGVAAGGRGYSKAWEGMGCLIECTYTRISDNPADAIAWPKIAAMSREVWS